MYTILTWILATSTTSSVSHNQTICQTTKMFSALVSRPLVSPKPHSSLVTSHIVCLMSVDRDPSERSGFTASRMSPRSFSSSLFPSTINFFSRMRLSTVCRKLSPSSTPSATLGGLSRLPSSCSWTRSIDSRRSCQLAQWRTTSQITREEMTMLWLVTTF